MSYVRDTDKLPRNSWDPVSACEAARAKSVVDGIEALVAKGKAASAQIAGPESFRQLGAAVVIDVARSQNAQAALPMPQPGNVQAETRAAPRVLPLNVTEQEYSGCSMRGIFSLVPIPVPAPVVVMPPQAPARVAVAEVAQAPKYGNLCWALRNGAVDYSQFDPAEYQALQIRCMELGYTGACVAPPLIALWLDQQRRAGTLPHISVGPGALASIPQAPPLTGVSCPGSWKLAGMAGYRGLGAPWGDAGTVPANWGTGRGGRGAASAIDWKALLFFGAVGVGLVWVAGNGRR